MGGFFMLFSFLMLYLGCNDSTLMKVVEQKTDIIVHPQELFFGHIESGQESGEEMFSIMNTGNAVLYVEPVLMDGSTRYIIPEFENEQLIIQPGEILDVPVAYLPITYEHNGAVVKVLSNDEDNPEIFVRLEGYGDAPKIEVNPEYVDYGDISIGCDNEYRVTIKNIGNLELEIEDVIQMTTLPNDINIDYGSLPEPPWELSQNEEIDLLIKYTPNDIGLDESIVKINSNDPINESLEIVQEGNGDVEHWIIQEWIQEEEMIYDILWIIDNSGSMNTFQTRLSANMANFMSYINASGNVNFRMGFITTDQYQLVAAYIDNNTPNVNVAAANIVDSIGIHGSGTEKGLEKAALALEYFTLTGTFLREDANLIMIFVSDEYDYSPHGTAVYINDYLSYKSSDTIKAYAVIGDPPTGCQTSNGTWSVNAHFGVEYYDVAMALGGSWYSICEYDWSNNMTNLAQDITIKSSFGLEEPDPIVDTIEVYVNGQLVTSGWSYDPAENWIRFDQNNIPAGGQTIRIEYATYGCGEIEQ
jgi:hypothetical protein